MKAIAVLSLWFSASAHALPCHYDGSQFQVTWKGKVLTETVAKGFAEAKWDCGDELAALYDGSDFVVFDQGRFYRRSVSDRYDSPSVRTRGGLAGLYDGDRVWAYTGNGKYVDEAANTFAYAQMVAAPGRLAVYDGKVLWNFDGTRWESQKVRQRYRHTRLEASAQFVVFYDGDDLWVWERGASQPESSVAKYQFYFSVVLVGDEALGFYDGARLHGYCKGKGWSRRKTVFDPYAKGRMHKSGDIEIEVKGTRHQLVARTCQWK